MSDLNDEMYNDLITTKTAPLYKCKKCGFTARGLIGVVFNHEFTSEQPAVFQITIGQFKEAMPQINLCYKCWYDWHVANLGELEIVKEEE